MRNPDLLCWDTNVVLRWLNGAPGPIEATLAEARREEVRIFASVLVVTELVHVANVMGKPISQDTVERIDNIWLTPEITLVEVFPDLAFRPRNLIREAWAQNRKLTPIDSIMLATAEYLNARLQTWEPRLREVGSMLGIECEEPAPPNADP